MAAYYTIKSAENPSLNTPDLSMKLNAQDL